MELLRTVELNYVTELKLKIHCNFVLLSWRLDFITEVLSSSWEYGWILCNFCYWAIIENVVRFYRNFFLVSLSFHIKEIFW